MVIRSYFGSSHFGPSHGIRDLAVSGRALAPPLLLRAISPAKDIVGTPVVIAFATSNAFLALTAVTPLERRATGAFDKY